MSTVMCQGLHSCLDPQVKDTDTLLLTLTAPKSIQRESIFPENNITTSHMIPNLELSSWCFLQSLSNSSQPKVSKSFTSPRLNEKSLELCTGRLIIKVVEAPSIGTCFEAHPAHGRLQLRFSKSCMQKLNLEIQEDDIAENQKDEESVVNIMDKDVDGNESDVEVKMGMEKIGRPQWCKESGNGTPEGGSCHREPFWVAT